MNRSAQTPINDELLSAYIDGVVTNQERATVEAAISADPALAWELESLRRTVELVQALPPIALPRSFALAEEQVADVLAERRARVTRPVAARSLRQPVAPPRRGFWPEFLAFFNSGNLLLRNATAVAALLFVVVLVTSPAATQPSSPVLTSAPSTVKLQPDFSAQPASQSELAPAAVEESAEVSAEESAEVSADTSTAESVAVAAAGSASPSAEAEMAPSAQSVAPMAEMAPAAEAAPPGMDTGASAAAVRAGPEGQDASAAKMMPETRGGGLESGPALFQAAPAQMAPIGGEPASEDIPANSELAQPMGVESGTSPVAQPAAESAMDAAADAPPDAPVVEESSEAVAIQSAPAETIDEPVVRELEPSVASGEPDSTPIPATSGLAWAYWGWLQAAAGGLALLLGALWLYTRRV